MRKPVFTLIASVAMVMSLAEPVLADSKGGKSASSRSESSRSENYSGMSGQKVEIESFRREGTERSLGNGGRGEENYGHKRGEDRHDWDEQRHREGMMESANRPALTPEARALFIQARQAAFEYRTTGSAQSLAALQTLQASLIAMGFTRVPSAAAVPVPVAPAPLAVATPASPATAAGTVTAPGTSGVLIQ